MPAIPPPKVTHAVQRLRQRLSRPGTEGKIKAAAQPLRGSKSALSLQTKLLSLWEQERSRPVRQSIVSRVLALRGESLAGLVPPQNSVLLRQLTVASLGPKSLRTLTRAAAPLAQRRAAAGLLLHDPHAGLAHLASLLQRNVISEEHHDQLSIKLVRHTQQRKGALAPLNSGAYPLIDSLLTVLPYNVAAAILRERHEAIKAQLDSWAEDEREQAELNKKAQERAHKGATETKAKREAQLEAKRAELHAEIERLLYEPSAAKRMALLARMNQQLVTYAYRHAPASHHIMSLAPSIMGGRQVPATVVYSIIADDLVASAAGPAVDEMPRYLGLAWEGQHVMAALTLPSEVADGPGLGRIRRPLPGSG